MTSREWDESIYMPPSYPPIWMGNTWRLQQEMKICFWESFLDDVVDLVVMDQLICAESTCEKTKCTGEGRRQGNQILSSWVAQAWQVLFGPCSLRRPLIWPYNFAMAICWLEVIKCENDYIRLSESCYLLDSGQGKLVVSDHSRSVLLDNPW